MDDGRGHPVKEYFSLQSDCKQCPLRSNCISDKTKTKKVQHSIFKAELERAKARQQTVKAKVMKRKRSSTVEPVWRTLINYRNETAECKRTSGGKLNAVTGSDGLQPEEMVTIHSA